MAAEWNLPFSSSRHRSGVSSVRKHSKFYMQISVSVSVYLIRGRSAFDWKIILSHHQFWLTSWLTKNVDVLIKFDYIGAQQLRRVRALNRWRTQNGIIMASVLRPQRQSTYSPLRNINFRHHRSLVNAVSHRSVPHSLTVSLGWRTGRDNQFHANLIWKSLRGAKPFF